MILIDAIYVNTGGAKTLLDYLVEKLEKEDNTIFYLFDKRTENIPYSVKNTNTILYLKSGFFDRLFFYLKYGNSFDKVLCFGNVPPPVKVKGVVFTYYHRGSYIEKTEDFSLKERIFLKIKKKIIFYFKKNTDKWLVQTSYVKEQLHKDSKENLSKICICPFYKELNSEKAQMSIREKEYAFLYVSNAYPNKNHNRLIDAFCLFYDKNKKGKLILTVSDKYPDVKIKIENKIKEGYPIKNLGYISQDDLKEYYRITEYIIFPSTSESLGLGLLEGIEYGCKVIGADLPYTYAACEPSIVFNPLSKKSILEAMEYTLNGKITKSYSKVNNEIEKMIELIVKK